MEFSTCVGISSKGEGCLGAQEFLFKGRAVIGNGSISQVRPEDKIAADLQNGDIIVLSPSITKRNNQNNKTKKYPPLFS
jgi:hypothetical protein